jgi:inorganic pyrophosphatase
VRAVAVLTLSIAIVQAPDAPPTALPVVAAQQLAKSLAAAKPHQKHVWRDTAPLNADGTVNGYIEISRGDRRKWEFDMVRNDRAIDRVMPESVGGFPVNYGFVPQTISYDGDPFDVLILGPAIPGGRLVKGVIVGLMLMEDEKGWDAKVVISRLAADGSALHQLSARDQDEIATYFRRYKAHEPGKFSKVPGWGSREAGLAYVKITHAFFRECRARTAAPCRIRPEGSDQGQTQLRPGSDLSLTSEERIRKERIGCLHERSHVAQPQGDDC